MTSYYPIVNVWPPKTRDMVRLPLNEINNIVKHSEHIIDVHPTAHT